jgi:glucose-6-phosphate isomerase
MRGQVDDLRAFAEEIRRAGFTRAVLCGMGGSSLAPEVLRETFGVAKGAIPVAVLDSTDPAAVRAAEAGSDPARTLYIISSKSGGTTEPNVFFQYFWDRVSRVRGERAGENFIAITDPGTAMERRAREHAFRRVFLNPPDIGGRYSALSFFGLVPAALMGVDLGRLLDRAKRMMRACGPAVSAAQNPGLHLGAVIGALAQTGRDKLTFVLSDRIATFGYWIEQLIAESTGKEQKGIIPVEGEPLGRPTSYGKDRVFVHLRLGAQHDRAVRTLARAGHPVVELRLADPYDLGGEFVRWEIATAAAGFVLDIDPFDQPNVQESKDNTVRLLTAYAANGALPDPGGALPAAAPDFAARLLAHLRSTRAGDYVALTAYFARTAAREKLLRELRRAIRDRFKVATTVGYGPRFLHSTGQLHKGGPANGVFIQLSADDPQDVPVPGESYTFGVLKAAQALGDYESLASRGRRVLRVALGADVEGGLRAALTALTARPARSTRVAAKPRRARRRASRRTQVKKSKSGARRRASA